MSETATIIEHLTELRKRLTIALSVFFISVCVSYLFAEDIYNFLTEPLAHAYNDSTRRMIFTGLAEAFFTYISLAMFMGFIISFPIFAAQLYYFLAPGLYKDEKKFLIPFLFGAPVLFLSGAAMVYYFIMPLAWEFFLSFESAPSSTGLPVQLEARVSEYLSIVMQLIIGFGLAFQMPIILLLLAKFGIVTPEFLRKRRRIAIVIIFIAAAILTPPDAISQIGLAVILMGLYELSIVMCKLLIVEDKTN